MTGKIPFPNKIINQCISYIISLIVFVLWGTTTWAQDTLPNKYGLHIINSRKAFQQSAENDPGKKMVNISTFLPSVKLDLKYATAANFTHVQLYPATKVTYLRKEAADRLKHAADSLALKGLTFKIWDAYRPFSITAKMWELIKDERYVADPAKGSGHNRGVAVDLTIIDMHSGKELNMGTGFDHFTDTAHHSFKQLSPDILANRNLLKTVMEAAGFVALDSEWWHYYLPDAKRFELLNLSFAALRN